MSGPAASPAYGVRPPSYRLPDATRLGVVRLQVSDLARSIEYYQQVIGLSIVETRGEVVRLGAAGGPAIVELHARPGARAVPRSGLLGLYHFAILLPHRAALGGFVRALAERRVPAGSADHLVSEAIYLRDPDGLGIEVYADRDRSAWRVRDGELAMATEPLDLQQLTEAAGGGRWSGLPEGTTIGHVHLHVGSLGQAETFYHAALGFDKTVWSYPGALFLSAGGYHHHLGLNTWAASARAAGEDDARLLEWEIVLPSPADVEEVAAHARAMGHGVEPDGADRLLADPWGTRVRVRA